MVAQLVSVILFVAMFFLLILDRLERHVVTLGGGIATIVFVFGICLQDVEAIWKTLNLRSVFQSGFWYHTGAAGVSVGINWETILFVAGMMVMVEGMADSGFFRWLCIGIARLMKFRPRYIFLAFMLLSAVLSMFIDSITVIMFLAAVTVELSRILRVDPVPFILAEIFCANLGGSATMCGDPPNIIIGTSLGYSFVDFIANTGVMALLSAAFVVPYFYIYFYKALSTTSEQQRDFPDPKSAISDRKAFFFSITIFFCAVIMLITHSWTGLTISSIGCLIAAITLAAAGNRAKELVLRVDYKTLLFFVGLFITVGGLEHTGVLVRIADLIQHIGGGNTGAIVFIIIWGSAIASAFVDNIPFAATMIPVIRALSAAQGVDLHTLAWALSMGTDVGGSATPIGASANVVGTSIAAKNGCLITWGTYCRAQVPATIMVLVVSTVYIFICYL